MLDHLDHLNIKNNKNRYAYPRGNSFPELGGLAGPAGPARHANAAAASRFVFTGGQRLFGLLTTARATTSMEQALDQPKVDMTPVPHVPQRSRAI